MDTNHSTKMTNVNLLIIGGGYSGTSLLNAIVEDILRQKANGPATAFRNGKLRILMVDRKGDFGGGLAYGEKVPPEFLLIDKAKHIDLEGFLIWLRQNKSTWLSRLEERGSEATKLWFNNYSTEISANHFEELHFPRVIFGDFARDGLKKLVQRANASERLEVELAIDEVTALEKVASGLFEAQLERSGSVTAQVVVLAPGFAPRVPKDELADCDGYVHDFYKFELEQIQHRIKRALSRQKTSDKTILILGSNNTAAEFIYFLGFSRELRSLFDKIIVASPRGVLPGLAKNTDKPPYICAYLPQIGRKFASTADYLIEALSEEYEHAASLGYTVLDTVSYSLQSFLQAFNSLPPAEKKRFVIKYGKRQQDLVRRVPPEYVAAVDDFKKINQLAFLKGRVTEVAQEPDKNFRVKVETGIGIYEIKAAVVANCSGFGTISNNVDPLITHISYPNGPLQANETDKGFVVSPEFETLPNLFVLGSLLTGFSLGHIHIWHLDSIPRIVQLANTLGLTIVQRLKPE